LLARIDKGSCTKMERLNNGIWGLGVRTLHLGKRLGISGPFEHVLWEVGTRIIRPPNKEAEVDLPLGMKMVIPPGFARARTYAAGVFERHETNVVESVLKDGMTMVDVGAFCGYYTLYASRLVGASGRVYAFEPDPTNYSYLLRNVEANDCRNVVPVNKAVFSRSESMEFALDKEAERHRLLASPSPSTTASITVPTVNLDEFFAQEDWPSVDLIKMDIEGGEKSALDGLKELSRRNPGMQLIVEYDLATVRRAGATREALGALLRELGFCNGYIIEKGLKPFSISQGLPQTRACYNLLLKKV